MELKQFGQVNFIRERFSRYLIYTISMQCSSPNELKRQCELIAENHEMKLVWLHGEDQSDEPQPNEDQSMPPVPELQAVDAPMDEVQVQELPVMEVSPLEHPTSEAPSPEASTPNRPSPDLQASELLVPEFDPSNELPPDPESKDNILNALNDDCLRELFETPTLSIWDLVSLAHVCKRFKRIAKLAFKSTFVDYERNFDGIELWRAREFFRTFGKSITSIDLTETEKASSDLIVRFMLEHCTKISKLGCEVYEPQTIVAMRSAMATIENLYLICWTRNFPALFDSHTVYPLKKLDLECIPGMLPAVHLPHLEHLHLEIRNCSADPIDTPFFEMNPQIKVLKLHFTTFSFGIDGILRHLPYIEELQLKQTSTGSDALEKTQSAADIFAQLKHLKRLHLHFTEWFNDTSASKVLEALIRGRVKLEHLSLYVYCNDDRLRICDAICQLKYLRQLEYAGLKDSELERVMNELRHLRHVDIGEVSTFKVVFNALKAGKRLTHANFKVVERLFEMSSTVDARALNEIHSIKQERRLRLNVEVSIQPQQLDTYEVRSCDFWSYRAFYKLYRILNEKMKNNS